MTTRVAPANVGDASRGRVSVAAMNYTTEPETYAAAYQSSMATVLKAASRHDVEFQLLLLCARLKLDSCAEAQLAALLRAEVDWDFLVSSAHQHRVLPLVYRTLSRTDSGCVPEHVMRRFRVAFLANAKRNLFLTGELLRAHGMLAAHGIPSIPYKGAAVAASVYGDLSFRQFADLDIIVPVKDAVRARSLFLAQGYRAERALTDEQLSRFTEKEKDITLLHDDLGINLEIHWGITAHTDPIRICPDSLWTNLETCAIGGRSVLAFRREDLLLLLCVHGAKHRWERLAWLCDVAEIVRTPRDLDWSGVIDKARRLGSGRILFLGLALASELLGAELPPIVLRAIAADPVLNALAEQVKGWLLSGETVPLNLGERERYFMRLREHSADRLRLAIKQAKSYLALTARDNEALPLPGFLEWSRYLVRPVRLAGQYGITPFIRFFKGIFQS
jgi:hypothetical protein